MAVSGARGSNRSCTRLNSIRTRGLLSVSGPSISKWCSETISDNSWDKFLRPMWRSSYVESFWMVPWGSCTQLIRRYQCYASSFQYFSFRNLCPPTPYEARLHPRKPQLTSRSGWSTLVGGKDSLSSSLITDQWRAILILFCQYLLIRVMFLCSPFRHTHAWHTTSQVHCW
jgi:hypothetical protein